MGTKDVDPTTAEIIRNQVAIVGEEMESNVMHSAYSPIWQDASDLSAAVLSPGVEIVGQSTRAIPIHVGTMLRSMRVAVEETGGFEALRPGDVLLQNDPYSGNNHLPDFLLGAPVFHEERLVGFSAIRGHWLDVGGASPTSYATDTGEIIKEGLRIPPAKLFEAGERNDALYNVIFANVRNPDERLGDFNAQIGGVRHGQERITELAEKYGTETYLGALDALLSNDEQIVRSRIESLPDGRYTAEDYLDGDGIEDELLTIRATVEIDGTDITVSFEGTDGQAKGGVNAPIAVTEAATLTALKCVLNAGVLDTSGEFRPIEVVAPERSLVNPEPPAPVVAGNHETAFRIYDTVVRAMGEIDTDLIFGAGEGSTNGFSYRSKASGEFHRTRAIGGLGACPAKDGVNAVRSGIGNSGVEPVERVEDKYDFVTITEWSIVPDTGGPGEYRGGNAARMVTEFSDDCEVMLTGERAKTGPYGVEGGESGSLARYVHVTPDGERVELSSKAVTEFEAGSSLLIQPSGGGGFGDPEDRPVEKVLDDVQSGYVTPEAAERYFSVVVDPETLELDSEATDRLRSSDAHAGEDAS